MMKKTLFNKRICYNDALKLIENGANVNEREAGTTNTPLFYVSNVKVAQLLIEHSADVNAKNQCGFTPLHFIKDLDVIKLLIKYHANVNSKDNTGRTPLHLSTKKDVAIASLFIRNGADVNLRDNYGYTALHYINDITDKKMIELFIKAGTDLNIKSNHGTVLSILNQHDYVEPSFCRLCIKNGALASDIDTYQTFREYFSVDQQKAFDAFASITSYDEDFFQMCLAYQNDQKNNIKIEIKDMDIL